MYIGLTVDGAAGVGHNGKQLLYDDGARPGAPRVLLDQRAPGAPGPPGPGTPSHLAVSPDGKQAAFLYEVDEGAPPVRGGCDFESVGRVDLYLVTLATRTLRRVQTIGRIEHCGIE